MTYLLFGRVVVFWSSAWKNVQENDNSTKQKVSHLIVLSFLTI